MRKLLLPVSMILALTVSACAVSPQSGHFDDPAAATRGVITEALTDMGTRPVLQYGGEVRALAGLGGSDAPAAVEIQVLRNGTAFGTVVIEGFECELMSIDGQLYVSAPEEFWIAHGVSESQAGKIDKKWTQVDPDVWFDPGAFLTPAQYVTALTDALESLGVLDVALPEPVDVDGVMAHPVPAGKGLIYISVEAPHSIVKITDIQTTIDNQNREGRSVTLGVTVAGITTETVEALMEDMTEALGDMSKIYDDGTDLFLNEGSGDFSCSSSTFVCETSVDVEPSFSSEFHSADKVEVTLKATADGGAIGTKKCSKKKTVTIGKKGTLSCSVTFNPPADGVTYDIYPDWTITGVATFKPDNDALIDALEAEFEEILTEMK